jgi:exonuclease III
MEGVGAQAASAASQAEAAEAEPLPSSLDSLPLLAAPAAPAPRVPRLMPARAWRREAARVDGAVTCVCAWRVPDMPARLLWSLMTRLLGDDLARSLRKLVRVAQKRERGERGGAGRMRVDMFVEPGRAEAVVTRLRARRPQWHVRPHRAWSAAERLIRRAARAVAAEVAAAAAPVALPAGNREVCATTWNVCSIARERDELADFVRRSRARIVALQETRLQEGSSYPLRLRGMAVFESHASTDPDGARGLALAVGHEFPASLVASRDHWQWVRVMALLPGDRPVYVCNVYVKRGVDVLAAVGAEAAEYAVDGAEVLILGDFNCSAKVAVRRLARAGFAASAVRVSSGSSASFHGRGRWSSSIDHMLATPMLHSCFTRTVVARRESRSDHWPVVAHVVVPDDEGAERDQQPAGRRPAAQRAGPGGEVPDQQSLRGARGRGGGAYRGGGRVPRGAAAEPRRSGRVR